MDDDEREEFERLVKETDFDAGHLSDPEYIREQIEQDPLSIEVRSGWYSPGSEDNAPEEYRILLCTGGPAVQIIGDLDQYGQPESARLIHQDWFTPWVEAVNVDHGSLLKYAQTFWFGEGR